MTRKRQSQDDMRVEPVIGSIERTVDHDDPFERALHTDADDGESDSDTRTNGVGEGNGESERDVIRMGGNGF